MANFDDETIIGYWGPTDSIADWCESNYNITIYIAEFYNTLSSIPIAILALIGCIVCYHSSVNETRFFVSFLMMGSAGLGSAAFHCTLRYYAQLLDQTPMLVGSIALLYCIIMTDSIPGKSYPKITNFFIAWGAFSMSLNVIIKNHLLFLLNYGTLVLCIFGFGCIKFRKYSSTLSVKLFLWSTIIYSGGFILWFIEKEYCQKVGFLKFHSIWHICAGYGTYFMVFSAMVCRATFLKHRTKLRLVKLCNTVPVLCTIISKDK